MPQKAALITGAAKRIGKAMALTLADLGYDIALHYNISRKDAEGTANEIRKKKVACEIFQGDLENEREALALIAKASRRFPGLNLLVNNASVFEKSAFTTAELKSLSRYFNVHLKAPFILSCEFVKICKKGQIINILDTHIAKNTTVHPTYLLSKKSLADFTKMSAVAFAPHIRVNAIAPGLILPPENKTRVYLQRLSKQIPLKRSGNPRHIAETLEFLTKNDYLTGQIIYVDGGEHLL